MKNMQSLWRRFSQSVLGGVFVVYSMLGVAVVAKAPLRFRQQLSMLKVSKARFKTFVFITKNKWMKHPLSPMHCTMFL